MEWVAGELVARAIAFDSGRSCLDLAELYLLQRRTAEVKRLSGQMVTIFRAQQVHREALAAVILFQGLEDEIVPPNQAETMVAAMAEKGIPHAYLAFEGEQHGFRKAENLKRAAEAELQQDEVAAVVGDHPAGAVGLIAQPSDDGRGDGQAGDGRHGGCTGDDGIVRGADGGAGGRSDGTAHHQRRG